jgi:hypothetical protein
MKLEFDPSEFRLLVKSVVAEVSTARGSWDGQSLRRHRVPSAHRCVPPPRETAADRRSPKIRSFLGTRGRPPPPGYLPAVPDCSAAPFDETAGSVPKYSRLMARLRKRVARLDASTLSPVGPLRGA